MPTFTLSLSFVLLAISQSERLCASRRGRIGHGAGHRVVEAFQKSKGRCGLRWSQCSQSLVPRHLRTSSTLPQGVRPAQGPSLISDDSGVEFPSSELDFCAVFHVSRAGLGRADSINIAASLRGPLAGAGREPMVERI